MNWQRFNNLNYLVNQSEQAETAIVFFHGYGADAHDLASLSQAYRVPEAVDWYFPQGVLEVPIGPMMSGRAWFELRVSDFEGVAAGEIPDTPISKADEKTLMGVVKWLNHLGGLYKRVIIGGFSQGAILTSHALYRLQFRPQGLVLFSGFLIAPSAFLSVVDADKIPFFQSHGQQDPILKISGAKALFEKIKNLGLPGQWVEFTGGHEIPMGVIEKSQTFLTTALSHQG